MEELHFIKETFLRRELLTHGNIIERAAEHPSKDNTYYLNILKEKMKKRLNRKPILRQKYLFDMELKGRVNINLNRICEMEKIRKIR
jgi:translation elongation factor EF-Ts